MKGKEYHNRNGLPKGTMESPVNVERSITKEAREVARIVKSVVGEYKELLFRDRRDLKEDELGENADKKLTTHIGELDILANFLTEFEQNPRGFEVRVQQIDQNRGAFTAGLKREKDPAFGEGKGNAQNQLRFYVQTSQAPKMPETREQILGAESLKGLPPQEVLTRAERNSPVTSSITINTVSVYREGTRTKLDPQAGIRISLAGANLEVSGVTYEGITPHFTDKGEIATPSDFGMKEYESLISMAKALSGYRAQSPKKLKPWV